MNLDLEAYEDMPLATQTVYGTITHRHGRPKGKTRRNPPVITIVTGATSAENNGISTEFDVPLSRHLSVAWNYDHSFIQAEDVTGLTLSWVIRAKSKAVR